MATTKKSYWKDVPHTNTKAAINEYRKVKDKLAIKVTKAQIRNANVSGVFELASVDMPFRIKKGELTAEVICLWHGKKPKTTWMHLTLGKKYELLFNYTGEVVDNISQ